MRVLKSIDFWSGLTFAGIGIAAGIAALDFDTSSFVYPASLSAALGVLGLALAFKACRDPEAATANAEGSHIILWGPALEICVWTAWTFALWAGLGYVGPAFAATAFLILRHVHDRHVGLHVLQSAGVALGVFMIFYLIFQVPLPELEFIRDLLE